MGAGAAGAKRRRGGAWDELERGRGGGGAPAAGGASGGEEGAGPRSSRRVWRTPWLGFTGPGSGLEEAAAASVAAWFSRGRKGEVAAQKLPCKRRGHKLLRVAIGTLFEAEE